MGGCISQDFLISSTFAPLSREWMSEKGPIGWAAEIDDLRVPPENVHK